MALDLANYDTKAQQATKLFWGNREAARQKQIESGKADQGERAGVTAGKNMDGFVNLIVDIVHANGLSHADIGLTKGVVCLPGYFRPTKLWDIVITNDGRLIGVVELKSQVGPSFGNNFNNRAEEAIGSAHDFWTAYREGAFGECPKPFLGWLMMVEDAPASRKPAKRFDEPHFSVFPEFKGASYLNRYDILCQKLVQENLYSAASLVTASRDALNDGAYGALSELTDLQNFVATFAGHIASEVARK